MGEIKREICEGVCRCCLERGTFDKNDNLLTAVAIDADNDYAYSNMLLSCFSINVTCSQSNVNDNLICDSCIVRLKDAYAFKARVSEAQVIWEIRSRYGTRKKKINDNVINDSDDEWNLEYLDKDKKTVYRDEQHIKNTRVTFRTDWNVIRKECGRINVKEPEWREHINARVSPDTLTCLVCHEKVGRYCDLMHHLNVHFPVYTCSLCQKSYATRQRIEKHIWNHKYYAAYKCKVCKKLFSDRAIYKCHVQNHAPPLRVKCRLCPQRFKDTHKRLLHMVAQHNAPAKPYKCDHSGCKAAFLVRSKLKAHISRVHLRELKKMCSACGAGFFSNYDLTLHARKCVHGQSRYRCDVCDEPFDYKKALKGHQLGHSKNLKFIRIDDDSK